MSYIVSYEQEEYIGVYQGEDKWKLIPTNENLTKQTGDSFVVESEIVEIKNETPPFIDIDPETNTA